MFHRGAHLANLMQNSFYCIISKYFLGQNLLANVANKEKLWSMPETIKQTLLVSRGRLLVVLSIDRLVQLASMPQRISSKGGHKSNIRFMRERTTSLGTSCCKEIPAKKKKKKLRCKDGVSKKYINMLMKDKWGHSTGRQEHLCKRRPCGSFSWERVIERNYLQACNNDHQRVLWIKPCT